MGHLVDLYAESSGQHEKKSLAKKFLQDESMGNHVSPGTPKPETGLLFAPVASKSLDEKIGAILFRYDRVHL